MLHLFWTCEKTQSFWNSLFSWLQSGRTIEKDSSSLMADAALGLRPDNSKYELQINFCFLIAKYFIWICKLKECTPKLNETTVETTVEQFQRIGKLFYQSWNDRPDPQESIHKPNKPSWSFQPGSTFAP